MKRKPITPWSDWFNMVFGASRSSYVVAYNAALGKHEPVLRSIFAR